MNAHLMPGPGDYEAFQKSDPLDPRIYDDMAEKTDFSLDTLTQIRRWAGMSEVALKAGDMAKALKCVDEIKCICDEVLG